jgi:hypothetical protein
MITPLGSPRRASAARSAVQASFAVTAQKGLIVGARSFPGNP